MMRTPNMNVARGLCLMLVLSSALAVGCASRGPRDVGTTTPRAGVMKSATESSGETSSREPATPRRKMTTLVTVDSRALALGGDRLFFGDTEDDTVLSLPRQPATSAPTRVASHAPMSGALSFDARTSTLAWVASPGDEVLRMNLDGGKVVTIRDRGIFANVVASDGDVFITEARGSGGVLTRVTAATAARLASFEGTPRGLFVDTNTAYVATSSRLLAVPRARGEAVEMARGRSFAAPQADDTWVYAVAIDDVNRERDIVRVKRSGGELETVVHDVRDAAIAVNAHGLYWFDATRPALLSLALAPQAASAPRPAVIVEDPLFEHVEALVIDDERAYAAVGEDGQHRIVAIDLR